MKEVIVTSVQIFYSFFYNQYHALNIKTNLPLEKCPFVSCLSQFFYFFLPFPLYNIVYLQAIIT